MIDKTVEYKDIIMVMDGPRALATPQPTLPLGFSFRFFNGSEDIAHWCRIEASVDEFDTIEDAHTHFQKEFGPHMSEVIKRCVFIVNDAGLPIATAMGWFSSGEITNRLHWIAVCPEYQGLGLGKAVSQKAVTVCVNLLPGKPIWLSTQTWSHRAVLMYHKLGFNMLKTKIKLSEGNSYARDYNAAISVLESVLPPADVQQLRETVITKGLSR
ncbi:MAG: GNAT family N-acetyltransferase [Firmicutes bacterium]|nr:GNAT family N-acetyltransferase [Bacillota bacterium]